jgi:hypothetical protein
MVSDAAHIHLMLDRIREQQYQYGALLQDISNRQEDGLKLLEVVAKQTRESSPKSSAPLTLPPGMVTTGFQYLAVLAGLAYLLKGGDLQNLAGLVKLFGLP